MEHSGLFFLNWKTPCGFIYHPRNQKKWQERLGVPGAVPPVEKSHRLFLHRGPALRELQYRVTVASDFNLLKVPLRPSVKSQSSLPFGTHTSIRKRFVVVLSFPFFSSETGSVVQAGLKPLSVALLWQPKH